jgi:hypothetical protein
MKSLLTLGLLALAGLALSRDASAQERVAQLSKVSGNVRVVRSTDGTVDEATQAGPRVRGGSVYPGDVVSTGPASLATMLFSDGSQIDLKEKTSLTVREIDLASLIRAGKSDKPVGRKIKILAGNVWTNVVPNPKVATEFETPSGVAAVKGTTFTLSVGEEVTP